VDILVLLLAASGTALATGLGAVPVFLLGARTTSFRPALWGFAAGAMGVASVVGLLLPALDEGSDASVAAGLALGVAFLALSRGLLSAREVRAGGLRGSGVRTSVLVFAVLFVHSAPEGLAIGTAYASDTAGLGLFVILAIALQNVPEGTSVAVPMESAGFSRAQQFWAAVGTSVPQPIAALAAFWLVEQVESLLPLSFAFAAGAMLALVLSEFVPQAFTGRTWRGGTIGALAGCAMMLALSAALGV
jgi:ZIP family zinc transporter